MIDVDAFADPVRMLNGSEEHGIARTYCVSGLPCHRLYPIGEIAFHLVSNPVSTIPVYWLSTQRFPRPELQLLHRRLPESPQIVRGFREAFEKGERNHTLGYSREQVLETIENEMRGPFLRGGFLPFTVVEKILINPTAEVTSFECRCTLKQDLYWYGMDVVLVRDEWKYLPGGDGQDLFLWWREPACSAPVKPVSRNQSDV